MLNVSCKIFSIIESDQQALCRDRMHARKGKVVSSSAENLGDRPQEEASYGQVQKRSKILSNIEDLDYSKAVTQMQKDMLALQATQSSFSQISNLTLFNYIS